MDTNGHEGGQLLQGPLVYSIVGSALEVLREVGHGLHEKPYENGLIIELRLRGHVPGQQQRFPVLFKGEVISEFVPDLIVDGLVVVDAKVIDRITDHERGQMMNYLRITKLRVGVILNFKRSKLEWEPIVL